MRRGLVLAIAIVLVGGGAGSAPGVVSSAAMLDLDVIFVATDVSAATVVALYLLSPEVNLRLRPKQTLVRPKFHWSGKEVCPG